MIKQRNPCESGLAFALSVIRARLRVNSGAAIIWGATCLLPSTAVAQWTTVANDAGADGAHLDVARVTNDLGHSLDVYRDSDGVVRGTFTLGDDAGPLDERSCPTFRIDSRPPRALTGLEGPCDVEGASARFSLGVISDGTIESDLLTQLMNGIRILIWYHRKDHGYHETEFTLRRSMQALMEAMGQVQVLPQ